MSDDKFSLSSDEIFESLSDDDSAEAKPAAPAPSPLVERLAQIHGHARGTIPPPDPAIIPPDSSLAKIGEILGLYERTGEISDDAMAAFYQQLREDGGTAGSPPPSAVYANARRPAFPAAVQTQRRLFQHNLVDELLHGPHPQDPPEPEPVEDIELSKISTAEFRNMRLDSESDISSLATSMATFRQFTPIVVVRDRLIPDHYHVLAGFRRFRAAQENRWRTIKCIVRSITCKVEALLLNTAENLVRTDVTTYELAVRCEELHRRCEIEVPDLAKQLGKSNSHIYCLLKLLSCLPPNALRDWQHAHPAATLARLEAVLKEFDSAAAWEKLRAKYEHEEYKATIPPAPAEEEADSSDDTGWSEFRRPTKAILRKLRDAISRAKLPSDPDKMREILVGFCDYARGAIAKPPYLVVPPLQRQRPRQRREPEQMFPGIPNF